MANEGKAILLDPKNPRHAEVMKIAYEVVAMAKVTGTKGTLSPTMFLSGLLMGAAMIADATKNRENLAQICEGWVKHLRSDMPIVLDVEGEA